MSNPLAGGHECRVESTPRAATSVVLWAACLGMFGIGVNGTPIMAALPTIRLDLALGAGGLQWALNAYLVASAVFVMLGGKAADQFGPYRVSLAGLAVFAIASAMIALAPDAGVLITAVAHCRDWAPP